MDDIYRIDSHADENSRDDNLQVDISTSFMKSMTD